MASPPGLLRRDEDAEVLLMIGTAGHVDHGKTSLIRLLTGCETDRLKVEKERGMSIELGFAPCALGVGLAAGIVDVPGHEQFIKNMVAGAVGMDMTLLLVAADDGVMPQTVEHLQIMEFLGVQRGMVVISKTDLVSKERVETVREEILMLTAGTFLEGAPIVPFSAETLDGFDEFYNVLVSTALAAKVARQRGVFRMPVERVFSPPGFGAVASGIPLAGVVSLGDEVEIQPSGVRARVRSIQRFGRDSERGGAGQCLALNLASLPKDALERGCVIAYPGYVSASNFLQVRLTACHDLSTPIKHGDEIRLHVGTNEVQGKLGLYEREVLERGQVSFGSIQLANPAALSPTDRFVIRRNSPAITIAGGIAMCTLERKPKGSRAQQGGLLAQRWSAFQTPDARLEYHFIQAGAKGSSLSDAARASLLDQTDARNVIASLLEKGDLLTSTTPEFYLHKKGLEQGCAQLAGYLESFHAEQPTQYGPTIREAATALDFSDASAQLLLEFMLREGKIERSENRVSLAGHKDRFKSKESDLLTRIEDIYLNGKFATPRPDELPDLLNAKLAETDPLLTFLCQKGVLIRLGKNVVFHEKWMKEAENRVVATIREKGDLDSADFKTIIDSSRKYALAILDHFDAIHITIRSDNIRRLHPAYIRKNSLTLPDLVH